MEEYDVVTIGAGPGGYVAALRAAQKGLKTALVEKEQVGGVCLNWGCIPTKTLLESAEHLQHIKNAPEFGINVSNFQIEPEKIWQRKNQVVDNLRKGIEYLLKVRGVNLIRGEACIVEKNVIEVGSGSNDSNKTHLGAKNIIIATGSLPFESPDLRFDHKVILSSTDILDFARIPKNLLIVGGGVIGCEFATLFSSFGGFVTIVELLDRILPQEDPEISKALEVSFKKRGIAIKTQTKVESFEYLTNGAKAKLSDGSFIATELMLVSVGRVPNSSNLGLERVGVDLERKGWIKVDEYLRTTSNNIYAIGDVTGKALLAHVASRQAEIAVENIGGKDKKMNYDVVPNCIFTYPEIASVGLNETKARELGLNYGVGKFPFRALGKAHTAGEIEGFIKLIISKKNEEILGAHVIGPEATELIATLGLAIKNRLKAEDILEAIYAHPTFSEIIPESIFTFFKKPLHTL